MNHRPQARHSLQGRFPHRRIVPGGRWHRVRCDRDPRGLTLVELLVSIAIVASVAGLLIPTIFKALNSARTAAIKAEIDMLNTALLNYRSEYGELPPAFDSTFDSINPTGRYKANGEAARHLQRLFPRCANIVEQLNQASSLPDNTCLKLQPHNAVTWWLRGFTPDPRTPLLPPNARVKLFDFDSSRVTPLGQYAPAKKPESPYIYIDSAHYVTNYYVDTDLPTARAHFRTLRDVPTGETRSSAWRFTRDITLNQEFFNPDTFQILCAGLDGVFGTDDDLSNFWPGTRKEYLDSLKQ